MSAFAIPLSKCYFLSHLSKCYLPPAAAVALSSARHRHFRRPSPASLSATNFSTHTQPNDYLSADTSCEQIEKHTGLPGEETSSDVEDQEEAEEFDAQEFELEARQIVKEFSDSLSRELKTEEEVSNQKGTRGKQKRNSNPISNIPDHLLPKVAIVGRPNVGKSALFNRLVGGNRAIVVDEPGVTRDRLYGRSYWGDNEFVVVDTGGVITIAKYEEDVKEELAISTTIGMEGIPLASREAAVARMPSMVERQATVAVEESSVIIFVVDGQELRNINYEVIKST